MEIYRIQPHEFTHFERTLIRHLRTCFYQWEASDRVDEEPYVAGEVEFDPHTVLSKIEKGTLLTRSELFAFFGNKDVAVQLLAPELNGSFDVALPQLWLNHWDGSAYEDVRVGTVWAYPQGNIAGLPLPVTTEALHLIKAKP